MAITHPDLAAQWHPTKNGDLTPQDVVAGTNKRIWWKCPEAPDHEWRATGSGRVIGSGCPACAQYGFNPSKSSWLYLMENSDWRLLQIGITNDLKARVKTHERRGWTRLDQRGPMDGKIAKAWETSILEVLRASGLKSGSSTDGGRFDGYTESWLRDELPASTLRELMDLVESTEAQATT